jgi:hypothetical protein
MAQDEQEPTWLRSLREQQPGEQPFVAEDQQRQVNRPDRVEGEQRPPGQADVMGDLREQMIQAEEAFEAEQGLPLAQFFLNLEPWQRLILAVFLFLDMALCGCMALVMAGRVALPF